MPIRSTQFSRYQKGWTGRQDEEDIMYMKAAIGSIRKEC
jgi:hypothetical protein